MSKNEKGLGIMGIDGGSDPMVPSNWWNDVPHCVFGRNDAERVFGTGHASFVRSPGTIAYQKYFL